MRIDSSGNVGIGTIPNTGGHNSWANLSMGTKGSLLSSRGAGGIYGMIVTDNLYIPAATGSLTYRTTNEASYYMQEAGEHRWYNAPSGSAGATATLTERMRIDSDGRLAIGNTTTAADADIPDNIKLVVAGGVIVGSAAGNDNSFLGYRDIGGLTVLQGSGNYGLRIFDDNSTTPRFQVNRSGNVGIGTANPKRPLQIGATNQFPISFNGNYPDIHFNTYYESGWRIHTAGFGAKTTFNGATGAWVFSNVASAQSAAANFTPLDRFAILANGNVGIGTASPYSKLWVSGPGINAASELTTDDANSNALLTLAGTNSLVRLQMGTMDVAPFGAWIQGSYDNTGGANGVEPLILNPIGGNVGIGTTTPSAPLSILNASLTTQGTGEGGLRVHRPNAASQYGYFDYGYNGGGVNIGSFYSGGGATSFGTFTFRQHSSTTSQIPMFIGSTGKVGIGTDNPTVPLDVYGAGWGGIDIDGASGGELRFQKAGATYGQIFASNTHGLVINAQGGLGDIFFQSSGATKMTMLDSGNFGIGTDAPKSPKQRRIEVTPTTTVSSNAWSASTGNNGGYDVKNDDTSAHAALGAITCAGVYNKQAVEWSLRGNMTANTWYPIATMGQLTNWQDETGNGMNDGFSMYFRIYAYDVSAGGPTYLSNAMTERIWVNGYTSNSNQEHRIHVGPWMGHAPNHSPTLYDVDQHYQMRIHHHYSSSAGDSVYTAQPTIELLVKTARTSLSANSGYQLNVYGYIG